MTSKFTAIYVRRSVSDKEKGNNSLSIAAQREECIRYVGEEANFKVNAMTENLARTFVTAPNLCR